MAIRGFNQDRLMWLAGGSSRVRPVTSEAIPQIYNPTGPQPRKGSLQISVSFLYGIASYTGADLIDFKLWKNGEEVYDGLTVPSNIPIEDDDELRAVVYPRKETIPTQWDGSPVWNITVVGDFAPLFPAQCEVAFDDSSTVLDIYNTMEIGNPVPSSGSAAMIATYIKSAETLEFGGSTQNTLYIRATAANDSNDVTEVRVTFKVELGQKEIIYEGQNQPQIISTYQARQLSTAWYPLKNWLDNNTSVSVGLVAMCGDSPSIGVYAPEQTSYSNPGTGETLDFPVATLSVPGLTGTYLDGNALWAALNATTPYEFVAATNVRPIIPDTTTVTVHTYPPIPVPTYPGYSVKISPIEETVVVNSRRIETQTICAAWNDQFPDGRAFYELDSTFSGVNYVSGISFFGIPTTTPFLTDQNWSRVKVAKVLSDSENPPPTQTRIPVLVTFEGKVYLTPAQWDALVGEVGQGVDSPDALDAYINAHPELWDVSGNTAMTLNLSDPVFGGLVGSLEDFTILPKHSGEIQLNTELTIKDIIRLGFDVYGGFRGLATLLKLGGNVAAIGTPLGIISVVMAGIRIYRAVESVSNALERDSTVYAIPQDMNTFIARHPEYAPRPGTQLPRSVP